MPPEPDNLFLSVYVASAEGVLWEGAAQSVSSANRDGPFDVLPQHARFITMLSDTPLTVRPLSGDTQTFALRRAVMHVRDNTVAVYVGI